MDRHFLHSNIIRSTFGSQPKKEQTKLTDHKFVKKISVTRLQTVHSFLNILDFQDAGKYHSQFIYFVINLSVLQSLFKNSNSHSSFV